jgi:hypothetical protein
VAAQGFLRARVRRRFNDEGRPRTQTLLPVRALARARAFDGVLVTRPRVGRHIATGLTQ